MLGATCLCGSPRALQSVSASSATVDQERRRQISNSARQMRGAFWLTYIMSAVREKLSMRAREM